MQRVDLALAELVQQQRRTLASIDPELEHLLDAAADSAVGGKKLRARFCQAGWEAAGQDRDDPRIARVGAAFEWLQASALVHDDVMDGSDTRRGKPSAHRAFEARHRQQERVGAAESYGTQAAILLGDLLLSWADQSIRTAATESSTWHLRSALHWWDLAKTEVIAGQFLDVTAQTRRDFDVKQAMRVVRFKSAKYTVQRPVHVGAALAGADAVTLEALSDVTIPLGEAFQLRDDLLGVFGDPDTTGKPAGDDLREGKRTTLIARTAERTDPDRVKQLIGTDTGVAELTRLIESSGARAAVETDIAALEKQVETALGQLDPSSATALRPLVYATTRRDR